jgi:transposase
LAAAARVAAQKKMLHASERDTPRVQRLRARWRQTRRGWNTRRLVFVDETGVNLALTRTHGRTPRGVRVVGAVPQNYGQSLTVLAALDHHGIRAALLIPGATDGEVFRHFVQRVLLPTLRRGDIVVWDNLSAHKVAGAAEALATVGATQQYLPPYSPDYNPIEKAWSKVKTQLRAAGARTHHRLHGALKQALSQITKSDAAAWFKHCGYPLH